MFIQNMIFFFIWTVNIYIKETTNSVKEDW